MVAAMVLAVAASAVVVPDAHALSKPIELARYDIEAKGKITELLVEDVDGDGLKDLVMILGREVRIYYQRPTGFLPEYDQRFQIDPRATIFDVADVFGDGKKTICFIREDGVYAYPLKPGKAAGEKPYFELKAKKLVSATTVLRKPSDDEVRRKEFLRDIDGDGKVDILVPERTGFGFWKGLGDGKFAEKQPLLAPPVSVVNVGDDHLSSNLTASYFFPNPTIADFDGDGRSEVVLVQGDKLEVFRTQPRLALTPAWRLDVPGQKAFSLDVEKPFELDFTMPLVLRDLNKDGRVDAALTHVGTGTTSVFLNGPDPATAFKTPARVVRAKGVTLLAFFVDLDGDGLDDMILPRMDKIGIWAILKVLVTRSVPIEAQFYYQRKSGTGPLYPEEPDFAKTVDIPISIHSKGNGFDAGTSFVASLDGDFDGDGIKDLVYRTDATKLKIFPGLPGRKGVSDSAACELEIVSTDDFRFVQPLVEDLNGDARADIVLRYYSWDRKGDRVSVFVSR